MRSFMTILGIAILFAAASGKNLNLNLASSDELFKPNLNEPKAMLVRTENHQTTIRHLKSGDIFQIPEWEDDKFLFLHFDGKHFFYLNLSIKDSVPSREFKNIYVTRIGNVKSML